jgi:hypothetical protein
MERKQDRLHRLIGIVDFPKEEAAREDAGAAFRQIPDV